MTLDSGSVTVVEEIVRDGSYASDFKFESDSLEALVSSLDNLTFVDYIDIGPGTGFGTQMPTPKPSDGEHMEIAANAVSDSELTTLFLPDIAGKKEADIVASYDDVIGMVRIGVDADNVSAATDLLDTCTALNVTTSLNLLKTYLVSPEEAAEAARFAVDHGVDTVYVVDSAGGFRPSDVTNYVTRIQETTGAEIGYHGHDNVGMALRNTLSAIDAGAKYVDASLQGIGRSAGNLQTELLCARFQESLNREDWNRLVTLEKLLTEIYPGENGIAVKDVLYGLARFHSSFEPDLREFADKHDERFLDILVFAARNQLATISEIRKEYECHGPVSEH